MNRKNLASIFAQEAKKINETVSFDSIENVSVSGFVFSKLREYNLHHIFFELYKEHSADKRIANLKSVYVIMAYSYDSKWVDVEQDRYINKKDILTSLIADSGVGIAEHEIEIIINNKDDVLVNCINYYLESQKNSDWTAIIALTEHIALCNKMAMRTNDVSDKNLNDRTKYLGEIEECEKRLIDITERLELKFRNLDEVMYKEGRKPLTKDIDMTKFEERLNYKKSQLI